MTMKLPGSGVSVAPFLLLAAILLSTLVAQAQSTNSLSDAEVQGQQLVRKISEQLAQQPEGSSTNTGILRIRGQNGARSELSLECVTTVTGTNWQIVYEVSSTNHLVTLRIIHTVDQPNSYFYLNPVPVLGDIPTLGHLYRQNHLSGDEIMAPFAGSDFYMGDLGLEFLVWPGQKVLKKEIHRSCGCSVLESTNPHPTPTGYSRVVSWIDNDTLGIVEAYAYDANGKKIKDFYPKDFKKINGQWQVRTLEMDNVQTGSRSRLEFDLKK